MKNPVIVIAFLLSLAALQWQQVSALSLLSSSIIHQQSTTTTKASTQCQRRTFVQQTFPAAFMGLILPQGRNSVAVAADTKNNLRELQSLLQQAQKQLDPIPSIIEKQQWDKVRAILITPPLSDCWTNSKRSSNLLQDVANAVGDAGGDELAILEVCIIIFEWREDLYLDNKLSSLLFHISNLLFFSCPSQ